MTEEPESVARTCLLLDDTEISLIIDALRLYQQYGTQGEYMSDEEIDDLCEYINCGPSEDDHERRPSILLTYEALDLPALELCLPPPITGRIVTNIKGLDVYSVDEGSCIPEDDKEDGASGHEIDYVEDVKLAHDQAWDKLIADEQDCDEEDEDDE